MPSCGVSCMVHGTCHACRAGASGACMPSV
jgi:hypothetical protein